MQHLDLYLQALAVSGAVFLALWPISVLRRNVGVVDAWWGPGFLAGIAVLWVAAGTPGHDRALLVLGLVAIWSLRLGAVMIRRWLSHREEDRRYHLVRRAWGEGFWWKSLFIVFVLQGVLQWLVLLGPMSAVAAPAAPLGLLGVIGAMIALSGLGLEAAADWQLDRFKRSAPADRVCDEGLRAHVKHPNYLGEMTFWWGVWLISVDVAPWWSALSPLLLSLLIIKVSGAPLLDEAMRRHRPAWDAYAARTPAFIPRLRPVRRQAAE